MKNLTEKEWMKVESLLSNQWKAHPGYRQDVTLTIETGL